MRLKSSPPTNWGYTRLSREDHCRQVGSYDVSSSDSRVLGPFHHLNPFYFFRQIQGNMEKISEIRDEGNWETLNSLNMTGCRKRSEGGERRGYGKEEENKTKHLHKE